MTQDVAILPMDEGTYSVTITEGDETTNHRVVVGDVLLDALGIPELDRERLVEEAVAALLDDYPVTSLPHDIDLDEVYRADPELLPELTARLT